MSSENEIKHSEIMTCMFSLIAAAYFFIYLPICQYIEDSYYFIDNLGWPKSSLDFILNQRHIDSDERMAQLFWSSTL